MDIELVIIFLVLLFILAYWFKEDVKDYFIDLTTIPTEDPTLSKDQLEAMDKTLDNSDGVDRYLYGYESEQTDYDLLNGTFPQDGMIADPVRASNLYPRTVDKKFMTFDDKASADGLRRSKHNKEAILGAVRNRTDMTKRIYEEELQEAERAAWYEDALMDIAVDDPKFFVPEFALPDARLKYPKYR